MPATDDYDSGLKAKFYPTELFSCIDCAHVQLGFVVPQETMFNEKYAFRSGFSAGLKKHFEDLAVVLQKEAELTPESFVIDIGCNDGTLLLAVKGYVGCRIYGIDPAAGDKVPGTKALLEDSVASRITNIYGKADLVIATNVFGHVPDPIRFLNTARRLLKPNGAFVCEVGNFDAIQSQMVWETIYHEHLHYFRIDNLNILFRRTGFEAKYFEHISVHGGLIRAVCKSIPVKVFQKEKADTPIKDLNAVERNIEYRKNRILELCDGKDNVVAFGASAKAAVILHQTGLRPLVVVDDNPFKQNKWMPGTDIPIKDRSILKGLDGKILILAWNEIKAIAESLPEFKNKMVVAAPEPYVM